MYLQGRPSTNESKTLWSIVNSFRNTEHNKEQINEIRYCDKSYNDSEAIANVFGEYLSTVINNKMSTHFNVLSNTCTIGQMVGQSMFFTPVTSDDVVNVIKILPNKKTTGPDDIPISIIKANCELIAPILSELINASVLKGVFPSSLKQASIALIFKKGDPLDVENYRPIALLSIFSKIIEKVIAIKLESFLNKNQIITESQYGFRAGFSLQIYAPLIVSNI